LYVRPFGAVLGRGLDAVGLAKRPVYVNPRDIMFVIARKRAGAASS
jgi:hypothetical protein